MLTEYTKVDIVTRENGSSGAPFKCLEVYFVEPPTELTHISFQNYYTGFLRIDQRVQGSSCCTLRPTYIRQCSGAYETVLDKYHLMKSVHHEDDAQNWHILKCDHVSPGKKLGHVMVTCNFLLVGALESCTTRPINLLPYATVSDLGKGRIPCHHLTCIITGPPFVVGAPEFEIL
jgi:hypothetical protein